MAQSNEQGHSRRKFLGALSAVAATTAVAGTPAATAASQVAPSEPAARSAKLKQGDTRLDTAARIREQAAAMAGDIGLPTHTASGDERADLSYALSFTKGLPHNYQTGLVANPADFEGLVAAIGSGDGDDFRALAHGPQDGFRTAPDDAPRRGWESPAVGLAFDLVGHDSQSLTMPPAPAVGSHELTAEMAEVYAQAILRDRPLTDLRHDARSSSTRDRVIDALAELPWFDDQATLDSLDDVARTRRRTGLAPQTAFRGLAPGETTGPYLSQLLLIGSGSGARKPYEGIINYGAQTIDQRVRRVQSSDFMTSWDSWFDVQNALAPAEGERATGQRRFITTGRDLATYVHSDALYQPYLNACLALFSNGFPLDPSLPYQQDDGRDHQQGFVLYGAPHVLSMLVEVCGRALKAVFFQKFNVHRRVRPEALAARIERADAIDIPSLTRMARTLDNSTLAEDVARLTGSASGTESMLLPMAYAEGSPMHPSYGAGHATVAGACVTILKTFFDHTQRFATTGDPSTAFVPTTDGARLATVDVYDQLGERADLTVEGELNKLAANISIGRDWAGVHYFSDYWESVLLGEQVAIQIMREHMLTVRESFSLRVPRFDGSRLWL